jgi:YD repeat-containing protein
LTTYLYDALGNLTSVTQNGSRPRSFTYDSLSRLLTASNPESGTITYAYDANSNVASKIAPAPNQTGTTTVATSYCYDALNRLLGKAYGSSVLSCPLSTPPVVMTYDVGPAGSSPIGRLSSDTYTTGSSTVSNTYTYTYDPVMGHSETTTECVGGAMGCQTTKGHYNLAGAMDTLTYPSGRVINNGYDTAARLNNVAFASFGSTTETYSYYTVPQTAPDGKPGFWPTGAPYWTAFGNGVTEAVGMNNRLQPIQFTATGAAPPRCHPRPS